MKIYFNFWTLHKLLILASAFGGILSINLYGDRFCNQTYTTRFQTSCAPCPQNFYVNCPPDTVKLTSDRGHSDCYYVLNLGNATNPRPPIQLVGCRHTCRRMTVEVRCCDGFWGPDCNDCPGGGLAPCNRNGVCTDSINGTGECTCKENFRGFACEECANNTLYGRNCDQVCNCSHGTCDRGVKGTGGCDCDSGWRGETCDELIDKCENLTCDLNSRCQDLWGRVMCACNVGYERDVTAENHTCIPINACEKSSPCDGNATCESTGPNTYNCSCNNGYRGDGLVCAVIDPCQTDHGGCDTNTSHCEFRGPGQRECVCNVGYEKAVDTCVLIDVCQYNSSFCDVNADCNMVAPLDFECTCKDGYSGDGRICYNNLVDLVDDLNQNDPDLQSTLNLANQMVQQIYYEELRYHGPFTLFLPNDKGFRTILRKMTINAFLQDEDYAKQILRQHIIVGEWTIDDLATADVLYTLQGVKAEISTKKRGDIIYRYRLHGSRNKGKIVKADILAANGIIHVINKFMTNEVDIKGDKTKPIVQLIKDDGRYNQLQSLIAKAGMEANFTEDNITVFTSNNGAWNSLPDGALDYLTSDKGLDQLRFVLSHLIFDGTIEVADLINKQRIRSRAGYEVAVTVTSKGQIQLDRIANLSQADIPAQNGLMHHVDGLLLPMSIHYILPSQCDYQKEVQVQGPCTSCRSIQHCDDPDNDVPTDAVVDCFMSGFLWFSRRKVKGCSIMCNRTVEVKQCCEGFYGPECKPCTGGFERPCSGNGQCSDGIQGDGTCKCDDKFTGDMCDTCADPDMYGKNCSQACTCVHGTCNNRIDGDGTCQKCDSPQHTASWGRDWFSGENCDRQITLCDFFTTKKCHIRSRCEQIPNEPYKYQCKCEPGYEGDGSVKCTPVNPCEKPNRGGCHLQARCDYLGPGNNNCTCEEGWVGDGGYCYPGSMCNRHGECDPNAMCRITPGHRQSQCTCNDGYHGNGTFCIPVDMCQHDNGGCHLRATCTPNGPGQNNCTCNEGYGGDGRDCIPTINQLVMDHPNLTIAAKLLRSLGEDNLLQYVIESYTFFVPTDEAMVILLARYHGDFWKDNSHITDFINFHTLLGDRSLDNLVVTSASYGRFETMYDGYYLHISNNTGEVTVATGDSGKMTASIIQGDMPALNGYVNIIDKALEPFISEEEILTIEDFFDYHPEYSDFGKYLEKKGLLDQLMDMDQYTLFVPTNEAMLMYGEDTVTTDFLSYYILPVVRLTSSFDDKEVVPTLLGRKHSLQFVILGRNVFVDKSLITDPDVLTAGGVVHGIRKLLQPVLNKCDVNNVSRVMSSCVPCDLGYYRCPEGFSSLDVVDLIPGCLYSSDSQSGLKYKGCNGLCVKEDIVSGCCAGFYGKDCEECPGGPEFPCNNNGICSDGLYGNGTCSCFHGYNGTACEFCVDEETTRACSRSCVYNNGGCHENATCDEYMGTISCTCLLGMVGDGHTCASPCEVRNGGCHPKAECVFDSDQGVVNCSCRDSYVGDGRNCHMLQTEQSKQSSSSSEAGTIVGIVLGILAFVSLLIAVVALFYFRVDHTALRNRLRNLRKGSESSLTFAPLNAEHNEVYQGTTLTPGSPDVDFHNPLYSVKDQFQDDD